MYRFYISYRFYLQYRKCFQYQFLTSWSAALVLPALTEAQKAALRASRSLTFLTKPSSPLPLDLSHIPANGNLPRVVIDVRIKVAGPGRGDRNFDHATSIPEDDL
ncbi:hypothetical protein ACFP76_23285, partial [Paracoccus aerius]|uniref:hypothetical protein n=1 Tax=Paracoccus aerius TaxID=1915382 RepID=UPI0036156871